MMAATMNNSTADDSAAAEFAAALGEPLDFLAEPERQTPALPERIGQIRNLAGRPRWMPSAPGRAITTPKDTTSRRRL